jgi:hypothetical protein
MTKIQVMNARHEALPLIETALGMHLAPGGDQLSTYAAFVLRRLVGMLSPCTRRDLVARAKQALAAFVEQDSELLIRGALEDLIVGGDVLELPVLVGGKEGEALLRLLGAPPSFVVFEDFVRIIGIASDDARFLPEDICARVRARGGDRFIDDEDPASLAQLLTDLGLRRIDITRWLGEESNEAADDFLKRMVERLARMGREGGLAEPSWLWPSDGRWSTYRSRWKPVAPDINVGIVRAKQHYGNPRWYFAQKSGSTFRLLDLPIEGEVEVRGCDLAWAIQLALDYTRGHPARYHLREKDAHWAEIRLEFPLPLRYRRRLLHLGGHRSDSEQGFSFYVPTADVESAEAILSGAWMVSANNRNRYD